MPGRPALHRLTGLGRPWRSLVLQSAISSRADNIGTVSQYRAASLYRQLQTLSIQLASELRVVRESDKEEQTECDNNKHQRLACECDVAWEEK